MKLNKFQIIAIGLIMFSLQLLLLFFILIETDYRGIYLLDYFSFKKEELIQKSFILMFVGVILLLLHKHKRIILKEYLIFICVLIGAFILLMIDNLIYRENFYYAGDGYEKAFLFLFFFCFPMRYFFISIWFSIMQLRKKQYTT